MNENVSNEVTTTMGDEQESYESPQEPTGGGDYVNVNFQESAGVIFVGIIALVLLWALLRSEARNRELQAQLGAR
jgi:hypothetical protein